MKLTIPSFLLSIFISVSVYAQVEPTEIIHKDKRGYAELINFEKTKIGSNDESVALFLKKEFKHNNAEFRLLSVNPEHLSERASKKYNQYYKGIKVEFGIQNVSSEKGLLKTVSGRYVEIGELEINPKITEAQALEYALNYIEGLKSTKEYDSRKTDSILNFKKGVAKTSSKGELVIAEKDLLSENPIPVLSYKFEIFVQDPIGRYVVYINALNGEVVMINSLINDITGTAITRYSGQRSIETKQSNGTYNLRDYTRGAGIITMNLRKSEDISLAVDFTDNDNNWTSAEYNNSNKDNAALDAHWGASMVYDYFLQKHSRNSFDGLGTAIKSYVHYKSNYENALWDGYEMLYGDGYFLNPFTCLDIVSHEIAHGVCSSSSGLIYSGESGALNESLSDIWGAIIEYYAAPTKQTYNIGEELFTNGGAIRSMSNPKLYNSPDTYLGANWYIGLNESTKVHTNSGVANHWFYILAEGKSGVNDLGNSYNVTGIGKEKAAKIVYRAETMYFTPTTNYTQARNLTIQAAKDLFGVNSAEAATVCQAWYAVGLGSNDCIPPPEISGSSLICDNNLQYTYLLSNLIPGAPVSWSVSSNLSVLSSSGTSIVVKPVSAGTNGVGTIFVTSSGKSNSKQVVIGKPSSLTLGGTFTTAGFSTLVGPQIGFCLKTYLFPGMYSGIVNLNDPNSTEYSWTLINKWHPTNAPVTTGIGLVPGTTSSYEVYVKPQYGVATYRLATSNACGTSYIDFNFTADGLCATVEAISPEATLSISPNPSTDGLFSFSLINSESQVAINEIWLYSKSGEFLKKFKYNNKELVRKVDLHDLSSDIYIVRVFDGSGWISSRIIKSDQF